MSNRNFEDELAAAMASGDMAAAGNIMGDYAKTQKGGMCIRCEGYPDATCHKCGQPVANAGEWCVSKGFCVFECAACDPGANAFANLQVTMAPPPKQIKKKAVVKQPSIQQQMASMKQSIAGILGVPVVVHDESTGQSTEIVSQQDVDDAIAAGATPIVQKSVPTAKKQVAKKAKKPTGPITAREILQQLVEAIKKFGRNTYVDKGAREVMDVKEIATRLKALGKADQVAKIFCELDSIDRRPVMRGMMHPLLSSLLVNMQDWEQFDTMITGPKHQTLSKYL